MGHTIVRPHPDDTYAGHFPYHGACLEGMASGPAIEERFGRAATALTHDQGEEALRLVAFYLGQGLRNIVYAVAPDRIVVGVVSVTCLDSTARSPRSSLNSLRATRVCPNTSQGAL